MIIFLGISASLILFGLFEIADEIANLFSDYKYARGYIIWSKVIVGAAITLLGMAILIRLIILHLQRTQFMV